MSYRPNLLLIMCDQLRADVLGCYGDSLVQTPNIDRLASQGVCFNHAYSETPVCVPARHGLLSGLYPFQLGLVENCPLSAEITHPLPEMIRQQGYTTLAIGKMHFSPPRRHYGFDRMILSEEIPSHIQDDDFLQFLQANGFADVIEPHGVRSDHYYEPQVSPLPEEFHTTAWTAAQTCEAIRKNRNRPFFVFTSFIKPHPPFDPCKPYDTLYHPEQIPTPIRVEGERTTNDYLIDVQNDYKVNGVDKMTPAQEARIRAAYYGSVTQIDAQIGSIFRTLEECGLVEDTLVIFTSDHGEMLGDHYAYGKRTFYEASARIPLIVSQPGTLPMGERRGQLTILQDIYATLLTASGGKVPESSCGFDLQQAISDSGATLRDEIYGEIGRGPAAKMMLRWGDFKYVYHVNGGAEALFHLGDDPDELQNIAVDHQDLCSEARKRMVRHYADHAFTEVLDGAELLRLPKQSHTPHGYLDQRPIWPLTVVKN